MATPLEELGKFASCDVADALENLGIQGYIPDIVLHAPEYCAGTTKIVGLAHTVKMVPVADKESPTPPVHHIDASKQGSIIVISAPPGLPNAVFGGLMAARAQFLHAKGAVIDGRCRDLQELRASGFPVFARGVSCLGAGNISISPDDIVSKRSIQANTTALALSVTNIIGDLDGVVRIPAEHLAAVVKKCEELTAIDGRCMDDIVKGRGIKETFAEHRGKK